MQKYVLISNDIRDKIMTGVYAINEQLPSEKEMCVDYGVSKMTIKRALDILVAEGLVIKRRGSGTFVKDLGESQMKHIHMANQFRGMSAMNQDKAISSNVLNFSVRTASPEIASQLNVTEDSFIYDVYRVRLVDGEPRVIEQTYMPIDVIPSLKMEHVQSSIYNYIESELKLVIQSAHRTVSVRKATDFEAEKLGLEKGDPVAVAEQVGYLNTGEAFELSTSVHRYDFYAVQMIFTRN